VRDAFPPGAWALATSDWYGDFGDPRCLHDAWLESVTFSEPYGGKNDEKRTCALHVRLLGAYHDGYIELLYPRVFSYTFTCADALQGHGDWRYDEFRLSERGHLLHEIEWWSPNARGRWIIEASDVEHRWLPIAAQ
jgi:hypothetical protein